MNLVFDRLQNETSSAVAKFCSNLKFRTYLRPCRSLMTPELPALVFAWISFDANRTKSDILFVLFSHYLWSINWLVAWSVGSVVDLAATERKRGGQSNHSKRLKTSYDESSMLWVLLISSDCVITHPHWERRKLKLSEGNSKCHSCEGYILIFRVEFYWRTF